MSGATTVPSVAGSMEPIWAELWPNGAESGEWSHSGAAVLADGRVLFAAPGGRALIAFDERNATAQRFDTPTADCHGLTVSTAEGREIVWIADPGPSAEVGGRVIRLDWATGSMVALPDPLETAAAPAAADGPGAPAAWRPTSTAVVEQPGRHFGELWIADGYGRSRVHRYGVDGSVLTLDGSDSGLAFDCPHGLAIDTRGESPLVVIADRLHSRLVFFDLDGRFVRSVTSSTASGSGSMLRPSSLALRRDRLLVTDLVGALLSVDPDDRIDVVLPAVVDSSRVGWPNTVVEGRTMRPPLVEGALNSPHGIAVGDEGQIYLTEWLLGGRQLRLDLPA